MATRRQNESKFPHWIDLADQGRLYWRDVRSRSGKIVRYIKIVDAAETTREFRQEVYDARGELIEIHDKFPIDRGHQRVKKE